MARRTIPPQMSLALSYLRSAQGWSQKELSQAAGIPANLISDYERGRKTLSRERLELMATLMGLPSSAVDTALGFLRELREGSREPGPPGAHDWRIEAVAARSAMLVADFTRQMLGMLAAESRALEEREQAASLWARLKRHNVAQRRTLVEDLREFRNWALCELLCEESIKAAADNADRALELAHLALRVAELIPGEEPWRSRVQGYAWAHVGNARRVKGDLPGADEAFGFSKSRWRTGLSNDSGLLDETRLFGMEASLRIEQRLLSEGLSLLNQALMSRPREDERDRLLIQKARTLEFLDQYEEAISILSQMSPDCETNDLRLGWLQRFTWMANLCHLGKHQEAETMLPKLRTLTISLDNGLDAIRLRWLEGRILAGLGRRKEGIEILSGVSDEFTSLGIAFDTALAKLELAVLYMEEGRTAEVRILARQMGPIFQAQGVHQEALAALKLFREAVEQEVITLDLARRLANYFRRAQHNSGLRLEGA